MLIVGEDRSLVEHYVSAQVGTTEPCRSDAIPEEDPVDLFGVSHPTLVWVADAKACKPVTEQIVARKALGGLVVAYVGASGKQVQGMVAAWRERGWPVLDCYTSAEVSIRRLLASTHLVAPVQKWVAEYAVGDVAMVVGLCHTLGSMPASAQRAIGVDDVLTYLPERPGAPAPWGMCDAIMAGDAPRAVRELRRLDQHMHPLAILAVIRQRVQGAYRATVAHGATDAQLRTITGVRHPYALQKLRESGGTPKRLSTAVELVADAERLLKSGARTPDVILDVLVVQLATLFTRRSVGQASVYRVR